MHTLTIDRGFVAGVGGAGNDTIIVRSILPLAAELGLFAVAEGIETEAQHEQLQSMGCTLGQGYFYGRPTPASEVPIERARRVARAVVGDGSADRSGVGAARPMGGGATAPVGLPALLEGSK